MKKHKNKIKDKSEKRGDDDMRKMRKKWEKQKKRAESGGKGSGERKFDELKEGRNDRRICPRTGSSQFFTESAMHFKVGPNEWTVRCIGEKFLDKDTGRPVKGTPCPICQRFLKEQDRINREYKRGDTEGRDEWRRAKERFCPRVRYYFNVITPDGDVKIHTCGDQVMEQLLGYYFEDDSDVGDFTALDGGCWMNIKKIGSKRQTKYKVFTGDPAPIDEQWDSIKPLLHDLDEARGEIRDADDVLGILKGTTSAKDEDDSSGDDEDADDTDDDDDDDRDVGDDEDEVERPSKKSLSKSKLSEKLRKRSKR